MSEIFGEAFDKELSDVAIELDRIRDLGQSVGATLTGSLRRAILEGRSLRSLLAEIGRAFADIALKAALKPLGTLVSGGIENLFAALNPALAPTPFAKGGVIGTPTYFPMPGEWGLAGEAGPEAIMPLRRGPDGRLGVAASESAVTVNFNVTASDARSFLAAEAEINAMLLRAVRAGELIAWSSVATSLHPSPPAPLPQGERGARKPRYPRNPLLPLREKVARRSRVG